MKKLVTPRRTANVARTTIAVLLLMLVASSCVRINLDILVNDDESGSVTGLLAVNGGAFAETFGEMFADMEDMGEDSSAFNEQFSEEAICDEFLSDEFTEEDFSDVTPYQDGDFCGVTFKESFGPGQALNGLNELEDNDATVFKDGDNWIFELDLGEEDLSESSEMEDMDIDELFKDAEYVVRVKLPGNQAEHNGDYIDDEGYVVWEVDLLNTPSEPLRLRTEPGEAIIGDKPPPATASRGGGSNDGGGGVWKTLLIVFLVLAALAAGAWFLFKKGSTPDFASAGAGGTTPTADPTASMGGFSDTATTAPPSTTQPIVTTPGTEAAAPIAANVPPVDPAAPAADAATPAVSPTPEQASTPTWDPVRGTYVQWDGVNSRWMVHDESTQAWIPEA